MTVTYGFYDSLAGDRKYNAKQMSQLFKGIISDGVFQTVGGGLVVSVNSGMILNVASGRAWFKDTWTDNDATITVTVLASEAVLNRIDAVVLEVNSDTATRANSIKVIKGTPASTPVAPTMSHTSTLNQYPLAYVSVLAGVTSITSDKITNKIGSVDCPFATGAVPTFDFGPLLTSWQSQFTTWFNNLVNQLSGSQVTNLQAQIDVLNAAIARQDNYILTPTVSGGNLSLAIKTLAGTDPSGSDPVRFKIGNTVYMLTAATTITAVAGQNWMNLGSAELATKPTDLFVYAIGQTGTGAGLKFGFCRIPFARTMSDLITGIIANQAFIMSNIVTYNATDPVAVIGRFRAQLSAGAGYTWSIPTQVVINRPIYETDWLDFTPVPSMGTGSGTFGAVSGTYQIRDKNVNITHNLPITANGTGNNGVVATVPFTILASVFQANGRENSVTGNLILGLNGSTNISYLTYANGHPGGNGYSLNCFAWLRIA